MGNEHREWETEKWERQQGTGNKVTDRARVQVRFCSVFHFPGPSAHSHFTSIHFYEFISPGNLSGVVVK